MLSTTTEDESDDCYKQPRKKQCRQKVLQSSSSDSDDSVIARPRRKKYRVATSSSDSDDSLLTKPSRKKCKVLSQTESCSSGSSASDSENEESLRRWSDKRPKKRTVPTDSDASSCEETNPAKRPTTTTTTTATTTTVQQADANSSDSDEGERCIICFKTLRPPFAHPSNCSHNFHPVCLATWSKTSNTCPIDRVKYTAIITVDSKGDLVTREGVSTPPPQDHNADFEPDDATFCEVCSQHDREHEMLLCDRCEAGYHLDCLSPPLRAVPEGNWYCPRCEDLGLELSEEVNELMNDAAVILESRMRRRQQASGRMPRGPRTRGAQRVFNIIHRQAIGQPSTSSAVTISRQRSSSRRARRNSSRRPQSTRYKVELITVEDGTTLEVKVAVNTRTRTKSKKHSKRRSKKKCSKSSRRSGESSRSYENSFAGEGPSRSLDLFGSRPTLEYFSGCEAEDELDEDRGGETAVLRRAARTGPRNMASRKQIAAQILNSNQRRIAPRIEVSSAPVDLVSSIMEQQEKWHSPHASYESNSNGNIRVILKDKAGRSRHAGGSTSSGPGSSGTSSAQPSASSSRSERPLPSTSRSLESGSSSMSQSSSKPRSDEGGSARTPSPFDSPLRPASPDGITPKDTEKGDNEQPRDKDEDGSTSPCSTSHTGDMVGSGRKEEGSTADQPASHDSSSEFPCQASRDASRFEKPGSPEGIQSYESSYQAPLESRTASSEHKSGTEENMSTADNVGEDCRLENAGSSDKTDFSEKEKPQEPPNAPVLDEEAMSDDSLASPDPEDKFVPGKPIESPEAEADVASHSPMMSDDQERKSDHGPVEEVDDTSILPDLGAMSDLHSLMSPNDDESLTNKPLQSLSTGLEDPSEPPKSPQTTDSSNSEGHRKDDDDQEAHSPFPCLENLEDCMPVVPRLSSGGFQVQGESQEDDRLSDKSSCDGDEVNFDKRTDETDQLNSAKHAVTLRRMSNCSDLSDEDSDTDHFGIKRDSKSRTPGQEDSDGEPTLVRHGQPCSPELMEQGRHSPQESRNRKDFNGLLATLPHEDISSDSINLNSSTERLGEHPGGTNRSEEERDGLVEITDEEMSNYERKWEMEKKLVENTELEGLEAISDVESSGRKSARSDDGENSGIEQLEDGLETISDLEAERPKAEKQEDVNEDTPKHQPSVPDVTPDDTQNEEEGEIRDDDAPVPWKKISVTKQRSYRGAREPGKEISKEIVSKDRERRVELDRHDSRISTSDRGKKTRNGSSSFSSSSSPSSSSTSSSESRSKREERSVSRVKRKRSRTRTRSKDRDRTRSRDRAKDRTRSRDRDRDRDRDRIRSRERARGKSMDRNKDRSRSRVSRDRYRRDRSRDRRSRSRDRKRRRTRSPRKEKSRSRDRSRRSRDRKRRRSHSVSSSSDSSTCSCSSCEREEMRRQKRQDRRDSRDRDRSKDKEKSKRDRSPRSKKRPGPSKEVFTSGDNILVSVNFKKDGEGNKAKEVPPPERKRERKKDEKEKPKKDRKESKENKPVKRKDSPKKTKKKKKIDTSNMKTVAIIDLDTSPFRVTSPVNELIILTDSDGEDKTSKVDPRMGPRTPPEPQMKFTLAAKKQQVRNMANPLLSMERDMNREDDLSHAHRGPNTPPEPEIRSPYDPFEPTKSPTPEDGRGRQSPNQEANQQVPQVSLTPPRARPQHVAPATPSPLHSPPSNLDQQDRPKLMPFQPVPVDSGDDTPGGGGGVDSPYSPGSSEGDDLFDPPQQLPPPKPKPRMPLPMALREPPSKHAAPPPKNRPSNSQKDAPQKVSHKKEGGIKIDENQQKLLDDLPNSAVEMQFIEKLHRQERVVEEVKLILKPHYAKKHINKDEYKEILRRAVPKICHSRTGEINPMKIQKLIDAYVQRFRHKRKLAAGGGGGANPIPPLRQNKPVVIK